ncbi:hypothetical protein AB8E32_13490 [Marinomonas polaris]|uniref:hypothetical protein n=1 Tax=Marinomonas polaris TaxID=293552 RepID=UPI003518A640
MDSNTNLSVKKSLSVGFKPYGVATVSASDGEPICTGDSAFRFEVRDGDCGHDGEGWCDCKNDRQRHEYTSDDVLVKCGLTGHCISPVILKAYSPQQLPLVSFISIMAQVHRLCFNCLKNFQII